MLLSPLLVTLALFTSTSSSADLEDEIEERVGASKRSLTTTGLEQLADLTDIELFFSEILPGLLKVRVPGTNGHHKVKMFIISQFQALGWDVHLDQFNDETPHGNKRFANIIATLNPKAKRRLILACHYDSKEMPPENGKLFLASTDSAVPCAMIIEIARSLNSYLKKEEMKNLDTTIQMVFFDGEEAFKKWTPTDSLYGARHLADVWSKTLHPEVGKFDGTNMIQSINALVLLDLIGAKNPTFFDQFIETSSLFQALQLIERRLTTLGALGNHRSPYFIGPLPNLGRIDDDHIPFLIRGVPILHMIPYPFPPCWHKMCDDESALDRESILNLIKIFRVFVAEYFSLDID